MAGGDRGKCQMTRVCCSLAIMLHVSRRFVNHCVVVAVVVVVVGGGGGACVRACVPACVCVCFGMGMGCESVCKL